jgi:hypothetical protein
VKVLELPYRDPGIPPSPASVIVGAWQIEIEIGKFDRATKRCANRAYFNLCDSSKAVLAGPIQRLTARNAFEQNCRIIQLVRPNNADAR